MKLLMNLLFSTFLTLPLSTFLLNSFVSLFFVDFLNVVISFFSVESVAEDVVVDDFLSANVWSNSLTLTMLLSMFYCLLFCLMLSTRGCR